MEIEWKIMSFTTIQLVNSGHLNLAKGQFMRQNPGTEYTLHATLTYFPSLGNFT